MQSDKAHKLTQIWALKILQGDRSSCDKDSRGKWSIHPILLPTADRVPSQHTQFYKLVHHMVTVWGCGAALTDATQPRGEVTFSL